MPWWAWTLVALAALYALGVAGLIAAGKREHAAALARFVPDCVVLIRRLSRDERLPRSRRLMLLGLLVYLASPIDLVADFIPVAGQLDDAILVALVLRSVARSAGPDAIREHWPGPPQSLALVLRAAGVTA